MSWFGEPWPSADRRAPVCEDDTERVPVPVGQACLDCQEVIAATDRGTLMPYMSQAGAQVVPVHAECSLRMVAGGPAHLMGACSCHGGGADVDDPDLGLSRRESALLVWQTLVGEHPGA